ncbi:hypothetical protein AVEN_70206-1 [Araneus ventricosus]|uniref:Uncharacterized protein n=1 Tax=Araneus ventricosus TaxID=182803 RepID=A0A4Y2FHG1_ARAVE|nr:hypothetical protein AVEN_70206-1 [Araneus ventricosus]
MKCPEYSTPFFSEMGLFPESFTSRTLASPNGCPRRNHQFRLGNKRPIISTTRKDNEDFAFRQRCPSPPTAQDRGLLEAPGHKTLGVTKDV